MAEQKSTIEHLKAILVPVATQIAVAAEIGIVLVAHNPDKTARQALRRIGLNVQRGKTTVYAMSIEAATKDLGHDYVTRKFLSTPPGEDEIKIFLVGGSGTALLTLQFKDDIVHVKKESDMHIT